MLGQKDIGDYAKTSGGAANQLKLFDKRVEDLTIAFGGSFIPAIQPVIKMVNEFIEGLDQQAISSFIKNGIVLLIEGLQQLIPAINPIITSFKTIGSVFNIIQNGITSGLSVIGIALTGAAQGWVLIFKDMLSALPSAIIPEGWIDGLDTASEALKETMLGLSEQITIDSQDMSNSLNDIINPEKMISEEKLELLKTKLDIVSKAVIDSKAKIETAEIKELKRKAARDKNEAKRKEKLKADEKKAEQVNADFTKALFGSVVSYEKSTGKQRADNLKSTLSIMATLTQSGNKTLAAIGKAAAISTATIDGIVAVQKALASLPFPANIVAAGVVGVAAAVNVVKISGMNFEHGGIVPGSSFTGDNVQANVNSAEMILNRGQQAHLFNQINNGGGNNESVTAAINALGDRINNMEIILVADNQEIARAVSLGVQDGVIIGETA